MTENYKTRDGEWEKVDYSARRQARKVAKEKKRKKMLFSIIGIILVAFLLNALYKQSLGYIVLLDDVVVAQVKNKKETTKIWDDLIETEIQRIGQTVVPAHELTLKKAGKKIAGFLEGEELKNLLMDKGVWLTEVHTVKVDGNPLFSLADEKKVESILEEYKQRFNPKLDEDVKLLSLGFKENIEIVHEMVEANELGTEEDAWEELETLKIANSEYEIKKGDNFWDIARKFETSTEELMQLNPEAKPERLMPGQKILIKLGQPQITVQAILETTVLEPIPAPTKYINDSTLLTNDRKVVEEGAPGEKEVVYKITFENGFESATEVLEETILKEPVERVIKKGTRTVLSRGVGRNYGVVSASRITSNYGWRTHPIYKTKSFHEGVDLAAPAGRPVYAYTSGTVSFAGRTGGLGLAVYINHGNGLETRYGHLSKIDVKQGQKVSTGAKIGAVGNTGVSTGPHLHFEVRKNGKTQNPWNYI